MLLLDELTTVLDAEDQRGVLDAVRAAVDGPQRVTALWVRCCCEPGATRSTLTRIARRLRTAWRSWTPLTPPRIWTRGLLCVALARHSSGGASTATHPPRAPSQVRTGTGAEMRRWVEREAQRLVA